MTEHPRPPSPRQGEVLDLIIRVYQVTQRPVSAAFVADRLAMDWATAREHFSALHRKGWLEIDGTPATPRPAYLKVR